MSPQEKIPYQAYLLRCWRTENTNLDDPEVWRFIVEEVAGEQQRVGFTSLEAVTDFLRAQLGELASQRVGELA
ncbi:MAG: hypothetical protein ABIG63_19755 [Chloroflexota bacterium]